MLEQVYHINIYVYYIVVDHLSGNVQNGNIEHKTIENIEENPQDKFTFTNIVFSEATRYVNYYFC